MTEKGQQPPAGESTGPFPPETWEALARYITGESTPAEAEALRRWLAEDLARARMISALRLPIERIHQAPPADVDVEAALRAVHARIERPGLHVLGTNTRSSAPALAWWRRRPVLAAAAVALLIGAGVLARSLLSRGPAPGAAAGLARTFRTAPGQRNSLRLADGTRVLLGPGSALTIPVDFAARRDLALAGEAYFDVVHEATRPLRVHAGAAIVQDVGTRFDVRSDDGSVRVVVTEGSVLLKPGTASGQAAATAGAGPASASGVVLHAGDAGTMDAQGRALVARAEDVPATLAWTRGELAFRGAPVPEVAAALRRWYGVELRVSDPALAGRHLTMTFSRESRDRVLEVIALALGARLQLHGDTAVLAAAPGGR